MTKGMLRFRLEDLQLGSALPSDIATSDGTVLAKAGDTVTQDLIDAWSNRGLTSAFFVNGSSATANSGTLKRAGPRIPAGKAEQGVSPSEQPATSSRGESTDERPAILQPYDEAALQRLEAGFKQASTAALQVAQLLAQDDMTDCRLVTPIIEKFQVEIALDLAAVLSSFENQGESQDTAKDTALAKRCVRMSVLSMVIATALDYSPTDCQVAGLAGMLHDIALFDQVQNALTEAYGKTSIHAKGYEQHPLQSASLLTYVAGVDELIRHVISQVHEAPNGTGFPRGQLGRHIHRVSKILHLVDAYLTLTSSEQPHPLPTAGNLIPADAIAYLLNHARLGNFDAHAMRGLVQATSLYPVGTRVELNDLSSATVLRSTGSAPGDPIIRLDIGSREIIDLSKSHLSIVRPLYGEGETKQRLAASQLDAMLWRDPV